MKIEILSLAIRDLDAGRRFYQAQESGLGDYFLDSLFSDIDALLLHAGTHQQFFDFHRALSKRFPYAVYYRIRDEVIEVWRVLDCRQRPAGIVTALKNRLDRE